MHSIANASNRAAIQNRRYESELELNSHIKPDDNSNLKFIDLLKFPDNKEEDVLKSISILELKKALSKLQKDEIELLKSVYFKKSTLRNHARRKGVSYTFILRRNRSILEKLKTYL